jgi:hypothetical protein
MMERQKFEIIVKAGELTKTEQVTGWVSTIYGIHKNHNRSYNVTHLPTKHRMFNFYKQKQAKEFVRLLESNEFPVPWENITTENIELSRQNSDLMWKLKEKAEEI